MRRLANSMAILLVLLVGLLGCELSPPLQPLEASPSPSVSPSAKVSPSPAATSAPASPSPSPSAAVTAIRGYVIDRNNQRLPGAKVAVGAYTAVTGVASASALDEAGQTVSLESGEFILLRVPAGDQTLVVSFDDATRSFPVTVQGTGATRLGDPLYLPVYGAVPSGSKALVATTTLPLIKVQKASPDASLVFTPETVGVSFKAPPNGIGDQIGAYSVTYYQSNGTPLAPPVVWNCAVDVPPAASATKSGPYVTGDFNVLDYEEALRSAWTTSNASAYLRLAFFNKRDGRQIVDRNGDPLIVELSCTLTP